METTDAKQGAASSAATCFSLLIMALSLSSCDLIQNPDPDTTLQKQPPSPTSPARFSVTRVGVIEDDLAYNARRGIYLIKDAETGAEFVGVSGVGISELGSHTERRGKTNVSVTDER